MPAPVNRLDDAACCAYAVCELFERRLLCPRFVIARRLTVGDRSGLPARVLGKIRYPRIHDVDSLYAAHSRCGVDGPQSNPRAMTPTKPTRATRGLFCFAAGRFALVKSGRGKSGRHSFVARDRRAFRTAQLSS